jgi:hypothetical protein
MGSYSITLVSEFAAFLLKVRKLCQRAKSMNRFEQAYQNGTSLN